MKEVAGRCMAFLSDTGVFECWSSRGRGLTRDDELKDIRAAIDAWMAEQEIEEEVICVFGCQRITGCQCFSVLWEGGENCGVDIEKAVGRGRDLYD